MIANLDLNYTSSEILVNDVLMGLGNDDGETVFWKLNTTSSVSSITQLNLSYSWPDKVWSDGSTILFISGEDNNLTRLTVDISTFSVSNITRIPMGSNYYYFLGSDHDELFAFYRTNNPEKLVGKPIYPEIGSDRTFLSDIQNSFSGISATTEGPLYIIYSPEANGYVQKIHVLDYNSEGVKFKFYDFRQGKLLRKTVVYSALFLILLYEIRHDLSTLEKLRNKIRKKIPQ